MVQVAWSTSNLKVYTARDGSATVCESCCDGLVEGDDCNVCDGPTPYYVTVKIFITGDVDCVEWGDSCYSTSGLSSIAGTYILKQFQYPAAANCWWGAYNTCDPCTCEDCCDIALYRWAECPCEGPATDTNAGVHLNVYIGKGSPDPENQYIRCLLQMYNEDKSEWYTFLQFDIPENEITAGCVTCSGTVETGIFAGVLSIEVQDGL